MDVAEPFVIWPVRDVLVSRAPILRTTFPLAHPVIGVEPDIDPKWRVPVVAIANTLLEPNTQVAFALPEFVEYKPVQMVLAVV